MEEKSTAVGMGGERWITQRQQEAEKRTRANALLQPRSGFEHFGALTTAHVGTLQ